MAKGLDVGTSYVVLSSKDEEDKIEFKDFRDAFYVLKPTSVIARKMITKGLAGKTFVEDEDGSIVILGQDAIEKAVERNESAKRPMYRGVVSPKEKDARRILALILKEVVGESSEEEERLVFCVPAQPIDQEEEEFDVGYHEDVITNILAEQGYKARAINEAEALCYSELENNDYTGIGLSFGAGMVNACVMLNGEPVLTFSTVRSGDWIDRMSSVATNEPDSVVQAEKEGSDFVIGEDNENAILAAVSAYYERLLDYTTKQLANHLEASKHVRKFKDPLPVVVGGGTSRAKGFVKVFSSKLNDAELPLEVSEVKHASDPLHAVSRGCLIAAEVFD